MKNGKLVAILVVWMLTLAPVVAWAQNAFVTSNYTPGGMPLLKQPGAIDLATSILEMGVPDGTYVINAKTSIVNADDNAQSGNCKLWVLVGGVGPPPLGKLFVIDQTEFRTAHRDGGNQQAIALQAVFKIVSPVGPVVNTSLIGVDCRAFNAVAVDSVLTAVPIGGSIMTLLPGPAGNQYEVPPPPQQF